MTDCKNYNLLALMPCPLKVPFEKLIIDYLERKKEEGVYLNCNIVANANNHLTFYEQIDRFKNIKQIPDIVISPGLNNFFYREFYQKFISKGYFRNPFEYKTVENFEEIGYPDSDKNYTMFTMNLLVLVINTARLKGAKIPCKWVDLLSEEYYDNIAIRGRDEFICETVLLNFYKEHGLEGIKQLSHNVREGLHPAEMVKKAIKGDINDEAVYVMPYFFARTIINRKNIEVVWPEDGAMVNAVSMLVKKDINQDVMDLASYILGEEVGKIFTGAAFPVSNPDVDINIFKGKSYKWLGWNFIKENDLRGFVNDITDYYLSFR